MDREQVLALKAGPEMDIRVAHHVMGWHHNTNMPAYSTTWEGMGLVMEKVFKRHGWDLGWHGYQTGPLAGPSRITYAWCVTDGNEYDFSLIASGETPMLAVCRAALLHAVASQGGARG